MDEAKQNRDRDGGVTNEKEPGENACPKCELRRQLLIIQAKRLEKTRSAMGEMKGKQEQADDVKGRDVNVLESVNHHRINVVMIERIVFQHRKTGVEFPAGKMKKMKNDEREHDQPAHDHVA